MRWNLGRSLAGVVAVLACLALLALVGGCGSEPPPKKRVTKQIKRPPLPPPTQPAANSPRVTKADAPPATEDKKKSPPLRQPGVLGDVLNTPEGRDLNFFAAGPTPVIDDEKVAAHGIRKLVGKHVTLYTDLKSSPEVDELPQVFDQAVPQWRDYFEIPAEKTDKWKVWGYVVQDKAKFKDAGLFPDDLPEFPNGYQRGHEFWLFEQPSAYYRRHLMLHEGTHAAMYHWLGGAGPPWYSEGMAELFGTHRWHDGKLTMRYVPRSKEEVPEWGRVRLIKDAYAAEKALMLHEVLKLPPDAHKSTEAYAWSWAATAFFNNHPRYSAEFKKLRHNTQDLSVDFTKGFLEHFKADVLAMQSEWQLFVANNEYGYDFARNALEVKPALPLPATGATVTVSADRGWQSTGLMLAKDTTYKVMAQGRYQLVQKPKIWWCEPGGVTIRYYHGAPLGMLVAAVRNDATPGAPDPLLKPIFIGAGTDFTPAIAGTLWLKINEHDAEWADNVGTLSVTVSPP
jgi:hypothetical protein